MHVTYVSASCKIRVRNARVFPSDRCGCNRDFHSVLSKTGTCWSAHTYACTNNWLCSVSGFPLTTMGWTRRCAMTHAMDSQLIWSLQSCPRWMPWNSVMMVSAACFAAIAQYWRKKKKTTPYFMLHLKTWRCIFFHFPPPLHTRQEDFGEYLFSPSVATPSFISNRSCCDNVIIVTQSRCTVWSVNLYFGTLKKSSDNNPVSARLTLGSSTSSYYTFLMSIPDKHVALRTQGAQCLHVRMEDLVHPWN